MDPILIGSNLIAQSESSHNNRISTPKSSSPVARFLADRASSLSPIELNQSQLMSTMQSPIDPTTTKTIYLAKDQQDRLVLRSNTHNDMMKRLNNYHERQKPIAIDLMRNQSETLMLANTGELERAQVPRPQFPHEFHTNVNCSSE